MKEKCCKNCKYCDEISYQYYCNNEENDLGGWDGVKPNGSCEYFEKDKEGEKK